LPGPTVTAAADSSDKAFFGHPRGLGYLITAECCWAFAYYGMVTLLTLYMTRELFTPGHIEHVVGIGPYRAVQEAFFGPMTPLALASQTFGLVTGLVYATPIIGGIISDRWLGQRRGVVLGFVILAVGHLLLVTEAGFLAALLLIVVGAGFVKSNITAQVGRFYGPEDGRRTRGYGLFLIAVNVGGFITPLVCGTLGEKVSFRYGLFAAALGMVIGLAVYLAGLRHMPPDSIQARSAAAPRGKGPVLARGQGLVLFALGVLLVAQLCNVATYNQAFNIFPVWAKAHVALDVAGFQVPVTWFSTLDGAFTIIGTAVAVRLWAMLARRGREPSDVLRATIGGGLTATGFMILGLASAAAGAGKVPIIAGVGFFLFADFALAWLDVVVMSLVSRAAPPGWSTTMMGVFYLSYAGGNFIVGGLGTLYERMTPAAFWMTHAAIAASGMIYLLVLGRWLKSVLTPATPPETLDTLAALDEAAAFEAPSKRAEARPVTT
jgi:POT family proton-dependent oligopeptide transporter